jgi:quercetin dioxygenase-like cupin family protein
MMFDGIGGNAKALPAVVSKRMQATVRGDFMFTRRRMLAATGGLTALAAAGPAAAATPAVPIERRNGNMEIKRIGSQPSGKGPAEYFTGAVRIDPLFEAPEPARVFGASVTFEAGARTAWHTHPLGQELIVTSGLGWAQRWGGPKEEIRPGDVIWFPPGEKHWHGATATTAMTHIAIVERLNGKSADWMEKVSDDQYRA